MRTLTILSPLSLRAPRAGRNVTFIHGRDMFLICMSLIFALSACKGPTAPSQAGGHESGGHPAWHAQPDSLAIAKPGAPPSSQLP
jgi:hypothetical protein